MTTVDQTQDKFITYLEEESKLTRQVAENNSRQLSVLETHLEHMNDALTGMREDLNKAMDKAEKVFVSRAEFIPVQKIVYGAVGLILISVLSALLYLVIK